jgi:RNA polymerase sigma-70 factor (ECF subfamily)
MTASSKPPPPGTGPDDRELAARAAAGDRAAFDALTMRHRDLVRRVLGLRVKDAELVEELAQATFVRAFEAIASFRGDAAFSTWLYTIATNVARNHLRDERSGRHVSIDDVDLVTTAFGTGKLVAREVRQRLARALEELSPKQRLVVELHLLHGMPFKEAAPLAACSEESARRNYAHALKKLREILLPDG